MGGTRHAGRHEAGRSPFRRGRSDIPAGGMLSLLASIVSALWPAQQGRRTFLSRRRQQQQGGAVIGREQGPTLGDLAQRMDSAEARLDEYDRAAAIRASAEAGHERHLHVVKGRQARR